MPTLYQEHSAPNTGRACVRYSGKHLKSIPVRKLPVTTVDYMDPLNDYWAVELKSNENAGVMPKTGGGPVGRPKQTNTRGSRKVKPKGRFNKWINKKYGNTPNKQKLYSPKWEGILRGIRAWENTTNKRVRVWKGWVMMNEEGLNSSRRVSRCGYWRRVRGDSGVATGEFGTWRRRGEIQGGTRENSGAGRKLGIQGGTRKTQTRVRRKQK